VSKSGATADLHTAAHLPPASSMPRVKLYRCGRLIKHSWQGSARATHRLMSCSLARSRRCSGANPLLSGGPAARAGVAKTHIPSKQVIAKKWNASQGVRGAPLLLSHARSCTHLWPKPPRQRRRVRWREGEQHRSQAELWQPPHCAASHAHARPRAWRRLRRGARAALAAARVRSRLAQAAGFGRAELSRPCFAVLRSQACVASRLGRKHRQPGTSSPTRGGALPASEPILEQLCFQLCRRARNRL